MSVLEEILDFMRETTSSIAIRQVDSSDPRPTVSRQAGHTNPRLAKRHLHMLP